MRLIRMEYKGMLTSPLSVMSTAVLKETDGSRHCLMTFSKDLAGAIQACQKRTMVQGALITHRHMVDLLTEAGWLAYPALAVIGLKILPEDLQRDPHTDLGRGLRVHEEVKI